MMGAHSFLNFIFLAIREKDEFYVLSLESVTSIQKPISLLKVVYHPVSCLLHHYIWFFRKSININPDRFYKLH